MKQLIYASICCMLMSACAKEENREPRNEESFRVTFDLSVANRAGEGFGSRVRDMYSQEALQDVARVNVHAFQKSGTDYLFYKTYTVSDWSEGIASSTYIVDNSEELPTGDYSFLALGQEATDKYAITALEAGVTNLTDVTASITNLGDEQEFFAGTQTASIVSEGARVEVELTRKVSGVLGYFKNVPAEINGTTVKFLRLSVSNANMSVSLADGTGSAPTGVPYNVIEMDLSGQTITAEGVYAGNDLSGAGVQKVANSQLAGKFVLPVTGVTMTLGLYDENDIALKTWNIVSPDGTTFDLTPNNFYSIGRKVRSDNTTGVAPGDPADPTKEDNPADLLTDQQITVTISSDWGTVSELTLQ